MSDAAPSTGAADASRRIGDAPVQSSAPASAWRRVAAAGVGALILLAVAWEWRLAPLRPGGSLLVLKALPLAMIWPGLARGRLRSFQVGSMLILAYVAEGVVRGMTDAGLSSTLGWIELGLAVSAFAAMLAHVRGLREASRPGRPPLEKR